MADRLEYYVQKLESLIQKKLLDSKEFHNLCHGMKDEGYHVDMGILALLMKHNEEQGFISFPFYLDFKDKKSGKFDLDASDKKFLRDLGISLQ